MQVPRDSFKSLSTRALDALVLEGCLAIGTKIAQLDLVDTLLFICLRRCAGRRQSEAEVHKLPSAKPSQTEAAAHVPVPVDPATCL